MQGETATAFFDKTYEEAQQLLIEARDYIATEEKADLAELLPGDRLRLSRETCRLTSRITNIMSWFFARKAVLAGEITPYEAMEPPYVLERDEILADGDPAAYEDLPEMLMELMERSHRLYIRVVRLDEMVRQGAGAGPPQFLI